MYIARIRTALLFCRSHYHLPLLLWLPGLGLYRIDNLMLPLILMKAATNGLIWYYIVVLRGNALWYYNNLHLSNRQLFLFWTFTDLTLFTTLLWLSDLM